MTSVGGQWIRVRFTDGTARLDWVPDCQPASPDGTVGRWHVVPDPTGGDSRWEWHPRPDAGPGAPPPAGPIPSTSLPTGSMFKTPARVPEPESSTTTQPLPSQAVPNRRSTASVPSVFAALKSAGRLGGPRQPVKLRWAAWSLSVVLAIPVVFLLTRPTDDSDAASPAAAQAELDPGSDPAHGGAADNGATNSDSYVVETPLTATTTAPGTTSADEPSDASIARYLAHLYNLDATQGYTFASSGDDALVSIGTTACGAMDDGATYDATRQSVMAQVPNGGQVVLAAAATYLCPQHHGKLQDYAAQQMDGSAGSTDGDVAVG